MKKISRRNFIKNGSCAAMSSVGVMSSIINLGLMGRLSAQTAGNDYKALVCLFLYGGNDSFNMLMPKTDTDLYNRYKAARSDDLALSAEDLKALEGTSFGVHPALTKLQSYFNSGELAFVANVGSLVDPIGSVVDYQSTAVKKPRALFSHNDQQRHWHTSLPQFTFGHNTDGWMGRMADILRDPGDKVSMNLSLDGSTLMQTKGSEIQAYAIGTDGAFVVGDDRKVEFPNLYDPDRSGIYPQASQALVEAWTSGAKSIVEQNHHNLFRKVYNKKSQASFENAADFASSFNSVTDCAFLPDPEISLARNKLRAVARTIKASTTGGNALTNKRQTFFVGIGGFDTHRNLLSQHQGLMSTVNEAVADFWDLIGQEGLKDKVTLFTASDFGRTLRQNGSAGTDHAWGGHQFILGGGGNGAQILGQYPADISAMDIDGHGRIYPTTSIDEYYAEMALWLGVPQSELPTVFPNLANFADVRATPFSPLGYWT